MYINLSYYICLLSYVKHNYKKEEGIPSSHFCVYSPVAKYCGFWKTSRYFSSISSDTSTNSSFLIPHTRKSPCIISSLPGSDQYCSHTSTSLRDLPKICLLFILQLLTNNVHLLHAALLKCSLFELQKERKHPRGCFLHAKSFTLICTDVIPL